MTTAYDREPTGIRCINCGFESERNSFFRQEPTGFFGFRQSFCAGCHPYAPTPIETASYVFPAIMIGTGLIFLVIGGDQPVGLAYWYVVLGSMGWAGFVTAFIHELGHAAAARLAGMNVTTVVIGTGPTLASWRSPAIRFELRAYALTGGMTYLYHLTPHPKKWREALMLLGGVGANLVLAGLTIAALAIALNSTDPPHSLLIAAAYGIVASQIFAVVFNLIPRDARMGHALYPTDGKRLLFLLRSRADRGLALEGRLFYEGAALLAQERYVEACTHFEAGHRRLPESPALFSSLIHSANRAYGPRATIKHYLGDAHAWDRLDLTDNPMARLAIAWVHSNVAWIAAATLDASLLPLADELSKRALEVLPAQPEMLGTRGAVLIEQGDYGEGLPLLCQAIRGVTDKFDKAGFAMFLARGEQARGNAEAAVEFSRLEAHLRASAASPAARCGA